jgi:hypothetical protein
MKRILILFAASILFLEGIAQTSAPVFVLLSGYGETMIIPD